MQSGFALGLLAVVLIASAVVVMLLAGLWLQRKGGGPVDRVAAEPAKEKGQYKATVVLSKVGSYFITIHSGFGESRLTLPAIAAVAVATQGGDR